ncbi:uncharacterized protein J3D65DRAFT_662517 [Phyllosticta citribraziliensis]|uniref:Uncharacterized protein n=1 Tax=Phyllosticta citribraziliensis TaxID=989973 RepID=A0ABR1L4Q1_9PEZI
MTSIAATDHAAMPNLPGAARASALRRLNAVGIDNLIDDSIKPRQRLQTAARRIRVKLSQPDAPVISMDEYEEDLIFILDILAQTTMDYDQVKQDLVVEVRSRQLSSGLNPFKNVRELLVSDVKEVLRTYRGWEGQPNGTRKKRKSLENAASSSRRLRPRHRSSPSEKGKGENDAELDEIDIQEIAEVQNKPNEPNGTPALHEHGQTQNEPDELMRVTVFYPIRETADAQDDDTSLSLENVLGLANSAGNMLHRTAANTRINFKVLPVQSTDAAAADAAFGKADKLVKSLTHLQNLVPTTGEVMQVPTRKSPEVHLMAAVSEAWDTARQAMHEAAALNHQDNDAELDRAREAHAQYERAEFEWRRNMMARLAQMQLNNANATSGLVLSPKLKELFEPVLL